MRLPLQTSSRSGEGAENWGHPLLSAQSASVGRLSLGLAILAFAAPCPASMPQGTFVWDCF